MLAFRRFSGAGTMTCVFNLSADSQTVTLTGIPNDAPLDPMSQNATLTRKTLNLGANGFAFLALPSDAPVIRVKNGGR